MNLKDALILECGNTVSPPLIERVCGQTTEVVTNLPCSRGRMDQAKRFASMNFDKWNDVTGFVIPHSGYYYEMSSLIEDAVEFGFGVAHGQSWKEIVKRIRK